MCKLGYINLINEENTRNSFVMSDENAYFMPFEIEELSKSIGSLPELHKCRVIGFLEMELMSYFIKSFSGLVAYKVNVVFDGVSKMPSVTIPEPVQVFGEVVHFRNDAKETTSALRIIILHNIKPCLVNPLYEIVKEIKEVTSKANGFQEDALI